MRVVIQRVSNASVSVDQKVISSIGQGFCILIGIKESDTLVDAQLIARKILSIKLFNKEEIPWKQNILDIGGDILCVSQFTLYANTKKGAKPDFHSAMKAPNSKELYDFLIQELRRSYTNDKIHDGVFGANMDVSLTNSGPVTILFDSEKNI